MQRDNQALAEQQQQQSRRAAQEVARHALELQSATAAFAAERTALAASSDAQRAELVRRHEDALEQLRSELARERVTFSDERGSLEAAWTRRLESERAGLEGGLQRRLGDQAAQLTAAKDAALAQLAATLERQGELQLQRVRGEHASQLGRATAEAAARYETELLGLRTAFDARSALDKSKIDELTRASRDMHAAIEARDAQLAQLVPLNASLSSSLQQTQAELQRMGQDMLAVRRECVDAVARKETEVTEQCRSQAEALMGGYQTQINRINAEHSARMQLLEGQQRILEEELGLAEARFRERPSRDEDLARIRQLEAACRLHEEQLACAAPRSHPRLTPAQDAVQLQPAPESGSGEPRAVAEHDVRPEPRGGHRQPADRRAQDVQGRVGQARAAAAAQVMHVVCT